MAIPPHEVSAERALVFWPEAGNGHQGQAASDALVSEAGLQIRQVELVGFKSFRDRTVLRFPSGVTGIVGPNGCGKSNVVDAIRWVLGEQSAKRLRGEGMEDVIFRGNERQGPVGMAQVSIVLESDGLHQNNDHPAAIMVTRRYYRSGESEYSLNGAPCRLRDITELFLGTGLGNKAYAIIEQDRVGQLIRARPEEIRTFIEEAAGTTLYRSRREVAERKMERTRDNLLRVHDLLREVERNLAGLRRQAKRAEQYRALRTQIEELELSLASRRRVHLAVDLAQLENEHAQTAARESELAMAIEELERERVAARELESSVHRRLQEAQAAAFEARSECEACRHQLARLDARGIELAAQATSVDRDLATAKEEGDRLVAECAAAEVELTELAESVRAAEQDLAGMEAEFDRARSDLAKAQLLIQGAKDALVEGLAEEIRVRNMLAISEQRRGEVDARCERLEASAAALAGREAAAVHRGEDAERSVIELQGRIELLAGARRERADHLRGSLAERTSWEVAVDGIREGLARVRSRRDSLREMEDSHTAYGEGVRAILAASSREEALGLVAEMLEIPAEHERAVAAVLGEQLQAVVTRDHEVARDAVRALRRAGAGRAICVPRSARGPSSLALPAGGRKLLELIVVRQGYEQVAQALLGNVFVVDDLDRALALWSADTSGAIFVTPAGETVSAAGVVAGGNERAEETLLAERRELRVLDQEVERREQDLGTARKRLDTLNAGVTAREAELQEVDAELAQVTLAVVGAEKDVERARQEIGDLKEQMATLASELESEHSQRLEVDDFLQALRDDLASARKRRAALEEGVAATETRVAEVQRQVTTLRDAVTEKRVALAEMRARWGALESAIERLKRSDEDVQRRITVLTRRQSVDAAALDVTRKEAFAGRERLERLEETVARLTAQVREAEEEITAARETIAGAERSRGNFHTEVETLRACMARLDVQATERRLTMTHLEQTIRERYHKELADEVTSDASLGDVTEEEGRLEQLRRRLGEMGDVNVAALGEVAEHEERHRLLEAQQADIDGALDDLKKTITQLNRTSRTRFRETFERVDSTFREVFPKLFKGGKAYLRLTDEDHVLDSGVEIVVQPPGKRVGPLDLLSGGEKALTAVSLIFALFLIKPSPFCFLDEVDAPLDDANIGRFNDMVKEMIAHSQVILITHNKRTMEVAETLYGITMEEPGVSRVVSVRLPE